MPTTLPTTFGHGLLVLTLLFAACRPSVCDPCQDPELVTMPAADASGPVGQWSFTQAYSPGDGTASSSVSLIEDSSLPVELTLDPAARTSIRFEAQDDESGVRCIQLGGGFGFTCVQPRGTALTGHGQLPEKRQCSALTTCGLRRLHLEQEFLEQYLGSCSPPFALSSGDFTLMAVSENMTGVKDTQFLTVRFQPIRF